MSDERNKPVDTLRDGPLKVSIFRNQGERGDFYSLSPGRLFTDNDGNTRETKSLNSSDALPMWTSRSLDDTPSLFLDFPQFSDTAQPHFEACSNTSGLTPPRWL